MENFKKLFKEALTPDYLKEGFKDYLGYSDHTRSDSGLNVIPKDQIHANKLSDAIEDSGMYAEWNTREGYFFFPEEEDGYDQLEMDIQDLMDENNIQGYIEGVFEESLNEQMDIYDGIANEEFGMDYDQLGSNEKEWVRDEIDNMSFRESVNEGYDLSNNEIAVLERLIMMIRKGDNLSTNQNIQKVAIPLLRKIMSGGEESINEGSDYDAYALKMYGKKWDDLDRDKQTEVVDAVEGNYPLSKIKRVNEEHDCEAAHPDQSHEEWEHEHVKNLLKRNFMDEAEARVDEIDMNDPALMKARAAKIADEKEKAKQAELDKKYGSSFMDKLDAEIDFKNELADLEDEREDVLRNMEEEAEPEGGPIADDYGSILNDIDARMAEIKSELDDLRMYESIKEESETEKEIKNLEDENPEGFETEINLLKTKLKEDNSYIRVSEPRFRKDKNNPNFLYGYMDYDIGPGGSSIALGKETMSGQIRRESSQEALAQMEIIGRKLKDNYDLEDIEIIDLENGKVQLFAVSDDFEDIDIRSELSTALLNEEFKKGDKVTYLGHPAVVTATKEYNGKNYVSVSYDKGNGKTKASDILVKSGTVKAVNEMEDEIPAFMMRDGMYRELVDDSVNYDDFEKRIYGFVGPKFYKSIHSEHPGALKNFYDKFRVTNPNLEEASDTDVGGGAKPNDGELDVKSSSDAALDNEVEKMGYNESKGFDFKQMVKEALTPKNLR